MRKMSLQEDVRIQDPKPDLREQLDSLELIVLVCWVEVNSTTFLGCCQVISLDLILNMSVSTI
jgi:hypothetical protein